MRKTTYLIVKSYTQKYKGGDIIKTYDVGDVLILWSFDPKTRKSHPVAIGIRIGKITKKHILERLLTMTKHAEIYSEILSVDKTDLLVSIKNAIKKLINE